jgi:hypothetical protein
MLISLLSTVAQRARAQFLRKTYDPDRAQAEFLRSLLQTQKNTVLGQHHGLGEIQTVDQFRERVPIWPYQNYVPFIDRAIAGEPNVLTADPIVYFNMTSGSTGSKKMIPVTRRSRLEVERVNRLGIGFAAAAAKKRGLSLGKMLLTSSTNSMGRTEKGIPYGPVSVSGLRLMNGIYRRIFAYPFAALQVEDFAARHYVCLLFALRDRNLKLIGANFPVLALRLCQYLEQYTDDLLHDLRHGTLADWLPLSPELRTTLERQWSAAPKRAAELEAIRTRYGSLIPQHAWPHLSLIITARGGTSNFYFERFPDYFGDTPVFGGTYASAEAIFGIHRDFNTDGVIPALSSGFYEFIPEDQWENPIPKTKLVSELTVGDRYRILVTNYNGFYRYDIGDVVEVEGYYNQTPLIIFRHRQGGVICATTEKTTEFHVIQTLQRLQHEFDVVLENFCVTLSEDFPAYYLLNIELAHGQSLEDSQGFLQRFEAILCTVQESYAAKRIGQIPPPRLRIYAPGSFAQVRQQMIQRGVYEPQLKFPHISEDRQLLKDQPLLQEVQYQDNALVV